MPIGQHDPRFRLFVDSLAANLIFLQLVIGGITRALESPDLVLAVLTAFSLALHAFVEVDARLLVLIQFVPSVAFTSVPDRLINALVLAQRFLRPGAFVHGTTRRFIRVVLTVELVIADQSHIDTFTAIAMKLIIFAHGARLSFSAILFVTVVTAIIMSVTLPRRRNTFVVSTLHVSRSARTVGAILCLIRTVVAVVVPIAVPALMDAVTIAASELHLVAGLQRLSVALRCRLVLSVPTVDFAVADPGAGDALVLVQLAI